jgi:hypothetical protein
MNSLHPIRFYSMDQSIHLKYNEIIWHTWTHFVVVIATPYMLLKHIRFRCCINQLFIFIATSFVFNAQEYVLN